MRILRAALILLAPLLTVLAGCRQDDAIQQETVTHEDRELIQLRVAILPQDEYVWFIRIDGPENLVKENLGDFDKFVASTIFTGKDEPPVTWTEPATWKKDPAMPARYASYRIATKAKELEVKITRLPAKSYRVMDNMHRWQKQVNVPLSESPEDNDKYMTRAKVGKNEVTWVNMEGFAVHTVSKVVDPAIGHEKDPFKGIQLKQGPKIPFKYTPAEGWVRKPPREFVDDAYEIAAAGQKAELTVSTAKGDPLANINRWRNQVGLAPLTKEEEISKAVSPTVVAGIKSFYVDLANPAGPAEKNRILGVIVPLRGSFWFIKLTGPHDLVGQRKNEFETFVQSFKR